MINKQSIYYWFFFPLLALLSAGSLTSCIYDSVLEETDMSGKSTLSITMRGITTTDPGPSGSYDDYVETLRVIGYDNTGTVVCNQKWNGSELTVTGTESNTEITLTQQLVDAFTGGTCEFYFIANEDRYSVYTNGQAGDALSAFLGTSGNLKQAPSKEALDNCVIATPTPIQTQIATLGSSPILMTTSVRSTLKPGDNTINNIELVRCFAKVQLKIVNKSGGEVSVEDPKLVGTYPDSYSLWDGSTTENWTSFEDGVNINWELKDGTIEVDGIYTSQEIYFPERLFDEENNNEDNAMKFSFTLNGRSYPAAIANSEGTDFNIYRNTHYTVTATLSSTSVNVTFNIEVIPWSEVEVDVPPFE